MDITSIPKSVIDALVPYLERGRESLESVDSTPAADLEISLHRRSGSSTYSVETRFTPPGSASEIRLGADSVVEVDFDQEALRELAAGADWTGYGKELSASFFEPEAVKLAFGQAVARAGNSALRLRLLFGPTAQDLHSLYWETLTNPLDQTLMSASQNILLSRYLASAGGREVNLKTRTEVKALAAAANPDGLEEFGLSPVDTIGELARARVGLKNIRMSSLGDNGERCSLSNLMRHLQDGYDILYMAAHGSLLKGQAWLWLEDDQGKVARVSGSQLADQIRLLDNPPLLVVLAVCESARNEEGSALQAVGPKLCEAGSPAVVAMQGKISMESVTRAMPVFFEKLLRDGQVDRALASARAALAADSAPDFWMPVLFMRLKDGAIWRPADDQAPEPVRQIWRLVQEKTQDRAAAAGALEDLVADPADPDNQEAFSIQLKKLFRDDTQLAGRLSDLIAESQKSAGQSGAVTTTYNIIGDVNGIISIGNNNTSIGNNTGTIVINPTVKN